MCLLSLVVAPCFAAGVAAQPAGPYLAPQAPGRAAGQPPLFRYSDVDRAWAAAQATRRPVFVFITSDGCYYCKKMLKDTLSHPQVAPTIASYTEPVVINASDDPKPAQRLGVRAYPTTLVISPDAQVLYMHEGYVSPSGLAERLWPVLEQSEAARRVALSGSSY